MTSIEVAEQVVRARAGTRLIEQVPSLVEYDQARTYGCTSEHANCRSDLTILSSRDIEFTTTTHAARLHSSHHQSRCTTMRSPQIAL